MYRKQEESLSHRPKTRQIDKSDHPLALLETNHMFLYILLIFIYIEMKVLPSLPAVARMVLA